MPGDLAGDVFCCGEDAGEDGCAVEPCADECGYYMEGVECDDGAGEEVADVSEDEAAGSDGDGVGWGEGPFEQAGEEPDGEGDLPECAGVLKDDEASGDEEGDGVGEEVVEVAVEEGCEGDSDESVEGSGVDAEEVEPMAEECGVEEFEQPHEGEESEEG